MLSHLRTGSIARPTRFYAPTTTPAWAYIKPGRPLGHGVGTRSSATASVMFATIFTRNPYKSASSWYHVGLKCAPKLPTATYALRDDDCPLDETTLMTPAHNTPTYYLPSEFNNWASDDIPDRNSNDGAMGKRRRQTATEPRTAVDGDSEDEDTYNEAGHAYETEHVSDDADKHDFDEHDRKDENDHDGTG
ncbi:hypothetical protein BDZ89DRAFT_1141963 [Hymenopellis radicata]|nr:hypothetical protein BDZ89DRAFT_1141963 [Hymenopellis radicata]